MKSWATAIQFLSPALGIALGAVVPAACGPRSVADYISGDGTIFDSGRNSGVTDQTLAELRAYPGLTSLALQSAHVTPAGLSNLRYLSRLTRLSLGPMNVTDAGLEALAALSEL